ncbi:MAG: hypothetical protein EOM37_06295 [Proteobacteria bacterium]|jgi:5'(3')-deoxyribonucleotidase|nr:hypothetical protein [Alphaproteobacteria bacterium]NCC03640.1 hypothetical protein [Pseudomonadota bacterium]
MKTLYFDMDGVLVDFDSGIHRLDEETFCTYKGHFDRAPHIFSLMDPFPEALAAYESLSKHFDTYILSTAPWGNPSAWMDKLLWVQKYMGEIAYKRLILSHNKHLNIGDYLIDDRTRNGADRFTGEHIHFGTPSFPDWPTVIDYLMKCK